MGLWNGVIMLRVPGYGQGRSQGGNVPKMGIEKQVVVRPQEVICLNIPISILQEMGNIKKF